MCDTFDMLKLGFVPVLNENGKCRWKEMVTTKVYHPLLSIGCLADQGSQP